MLNKQEREGYNVWGMVTGPRPYPENQRAHKRTRDRGHGHDEIDWAVKAALREERIKRSKREFEEEQGLEDHEEGLKFLKERIQFQFDRVLKHVCGGTATPEDIDYFFRHADELANPRNLLRGNLGGGLLTSQSPQFIAG